MLFRLTRSAHDFEPDHTLPVANLPTGTSGATIPLLSGANTRLGSISTMSNTYLI